MSFAEIKKSINSNLNTPLNELIEKGVIKSIQRGNFTINNNVGNTNTININNVNPNKCFVILNGTSSGGSDNTADASLYDIDDSHIVLRCFASGTTHEVSYISWQVIEFY